MEDDIRLRAQKSLETIVELLNGLRPTYRERISNVATTTIEQLRSHAKWETEEESTPLV